MTGMQINFKPLAGIDADDPLCYLLSIDDCNILLDCGWNDSFDLATIKPVIEVLPTLDYILLSHPDTQHLGALPYLLGRLGCKAEVYSTLPVHKMGQMFMYDAYESQMAVSDFDIFNLDDVDAAFARVKQLRYQQNRELQGKGAGIRITPFNAGHMVGGTIWRITVQGEDIVYAVDYNHRKERHLKGTVLESVFLRPALLITDARNALSPAVDKASRDKEFLDTIMSTLRKDGNVLLPVDTAGRVLELLLMIEKYWFDNKLTYPLALLTSVAYTTLENAKSELEWMNDAISRNFEHTRDNPFALRYTRLIHSREELSGVPRGPKVVLASLPSLEAGLSRQLFSEWAGDPKNAILFTMKAECGTLGHLVQFPSPGSERDPQGCLKVRMKLCRRVPLEGEELAEYERKQREQQAATTAETEAPTTPHTDMPVRSSSGSIKKLIMSGALGPELLGGDEEELPATTTADQGLTSVLIDGFTVPEGAAGPLFPFEDEEDAMEFDEYGAALTPNDFKPKEQNEEFRAMEAMEAEDDEEETVVKPTKIVSAEATVTVRAKVALFDFEGRSDSRSIATILSHVAPRKMIIVHGTKQARDALSHVIAKELESLRCSIISPGIGQTCDVSPGYASYSVVLSDELIAALRLRRMGDYQVGWLDAHVAQHTGVESLVLYPARMSEDGTGEGGIFIGDVRLSEIKSALAEAGISSEFFGGALLCSGNVVVKRSAEAAEVAVEGPMSEEYYRVRDVVYAQYNVC